MNELMNSLGEYALSYKFITGIMLGVCVGYLAGAQVRRRRSIGSKRPKHKQAGDMVEIYVGNLSYETDELQLRREFERHGKVKSARIISHRFNNRSKGFGFVEMPVRQEAEAAIKALHNFELDGRRLRVNEARNTVP